MWTSPLLEALRENRGVPTTTPGTIFAAAKEGDVSNYDAIDTVVNFGTKKLATMEEAWTTSVHDSTSTKSGNLDMQNTMLALRPELKFKRSKL